MANFIDLAHKGIDLAHRAMDYMSTSSADAGDDTPAPKPTPKKDPNAGLHPGESQQIKDLGLMGDKD